MNFDEIYYKYHRIIHYLLKRYYVKYNYDEFYQLLLIKLWQLSKNYNKNSNICLSSYLYQRLNFYLIDLFRKENLKPEFVEVDDLQTPQITSINTETTFFNYNDISKILNAQDLAWYNYFIQGYKQFEIADLMHVSLSSIKKYKSSSIKKLTDYYFKGE